MRAWQVLKEYPGPFEGFSKEHGWGFAGARWGGLVPTAGIVLLLYALG